jgi:hypothetical protein
MEQSSTSQFKKTLIYGTILGFVLVVYSFILHKTNLENNTWLVLLHYIFVIAAIVVAIQCFRNQFNGGYISYGKALGTGILIVLWASIILTIYTYILTKYIDPSIMEKAKGLAMQKVENSGNEQQSEMATKMMDIMMTSGFMSLMTFIGNIFFGTIFSLIIAAFLKKDKDIFSETE